MEILQLGLQLGVSKHSPEIQVLSNISELMAENPEAQIEQRRLQDILREDEDNRRTSAPFEAVAPEPEVERTSRESTAPAMAADTSDFHLSTLIPSNSPTLPISFDPPLSSKDSLGKRAPKPVLTDGVEAGAGGDTKPVRRRLGGKDLKLMGLPEPPYVVLKSRRRTGGEAVEGRKRKLEDEEEFEQDAEDVGGDHDDDMSDMDVDGVEELKEPKDSLKARKKRRISSAATITSDPDDSADEAPREDDTWPIYKAPIPCYSCAAGGFRCMRFVKRSYGRQRTACERCKRLRRKCEFGRETVRRASRAPSQKVEPMSDEEQPRKKGKGKSKEKGRRAEDGHGVERGVKWEEVDSTEWRQGEHCYHMPNV